MMKTILVEEGHPLALLQTYLSMILGSIGSRQYRNLYVRTSDGLKDVIEDGDLACAYFASSILKLCGLTTGGVHTTVDETVRDLEASGWKRIPLPRTGCVVVWTKKACSDGLHHRHIGFVVGGADNTVSNDAASGSPALQPLIEKDASGKPLRPVEAYYFHPQLEWTTG